MFDEVCAVYEGLVSNGATEVIVFDSHSGDDTTLRISYDPPKIRYVSRSISNREQFPSFDSSSDGIILWGYHVKAGSKTGKLEHTNSRRVKHIKINDMEVGEVYLHGLYAFYKNVPLLAASGDGALNCEVKKDVGNIPFFNSDQGENLTRREYLHSIKKFVSTLNFSEIFEFNRTLTWPTETSMEVSYKNAFANMVRWILRKQFRYARLKDPYTCIYDKGSFLQQWNQYNGFSSPDIMISQK
jgi:D-aminopeptidase